MAPDPDPQGDWYLLEGDRGCEHARTTRLGGDAGNNQYFYCEACEGVLLRAGEGDDAAIRRERERRWERRRSDPLGSVLDGLDPGDTDGGRSWLRSKLYRLFK